MTWILGGIEYFVGLVLSSNLKITQERSSCKQCLMPLHLTGNMSLKFKCLFFLLCQKKLDKKLLFLGLWVRLDVKSIIIFTLHSIYFRNTPCFWPSRSHIYINPILKQKTSKHKIKSAQTCYNNKHKCLMCCSTRPAAGFQTLPAFIFLSDIRLHPSRQTLSSPWRPRRTSCVSLSSSLDVHSVWAKNCAVTHCSFWPCKNARS